MVLAGQTASVKQNGVRVFLPIKRIICDDLDWLGVRDEAPPVMLSVPVVTMAYDADTKLTPDNG